MQLTLVATTILMLLALPAGAARTAGAISPIGRVISMIADLQAKIIREGAEAHKLYDEFAEFCEERSKELDFDIKNANSEKEDLEANIAKYTATIEATKVKIEELTGSVAKNEADLKAAQAIRAKESADFDAESKELAEAVDSLDRAIGILERELKNGASMLQLKDATNAAQALSILVQASALSAQDGSRLAALVQERQAADDASLAPPDAAAYEGQSGGIVSTMEDLLDKAKDQLAAARQKESEALRNFELLQQSLEDEIRVASKSLDEAKKTEAGTAERQAAAEGSLTATAKALRVDNEALSSLHQDCMSKARDFELSTKSRGEELEALAKAKQIIQETTAGADAQAYGLSQQEPSFLQLRRSRITEGADLAGYEVVRLLRDVAHREKSGTLAQLAARVATSMHAGSEGGEDPFRKVKGLIQELLERLLEEAEQDASHKAHCDKELGESRAKKADKEGELQKLSTKIEQDTARSAKLKEEVALLQKGLADLAAAQAEMDQLRVKERKAFVTDREELEKGVEGVKLALKVLKDYYGNAGGDHEEASSAGAGIIGLLETAESDLSKNLAEVVAVEDAAKLAYETETKENEVEKATKTQDVKYKQREAAQLDKGVAELSSDQATVQEELNAVLEYLKGLDQTCVAKAETYSERKRRREAELEGLKQALQILEGEAVLLETKTTRLRGTRVHAA